MGLEYLIFHSSTWSFGRGRIGRVSWFPRLELCVDLGEADASLTAWMGSQNLEFLLDKELIKPTPSTILREAYTQAVSSNTSMGQLQEAVERTNGERQDTESGEPPPEQLLLSKTSGKIIADELEVPALEVEIERAIWQVERDMKTREDSQQEKELKPASQKTER